MTLAVPNRKQAAPQQAIGYVQNVNYNWWLYENETTPELIWPQSIYAYDQMRRTDAQVSSVLKAITYPLRRTAWRIDPNGARDEVVEFVANDLGLPIVGADPKPVKRSRNRFSWDEHLRLALLMLPLGHSFFEQIYRVDPDGKRAHLAKLEQRPSKTIERIDVATDGGLVAIKQWWTGATGDPRPIPVDRLVAYVLDREGGNWLGNSLLRAAYKNWLLKDRLLRVQAQTIERNGMGVPLYTGYDQEPDLSTGMNMATNWRSGQNAGTAIPFGASLKLVGVEGTLPDAEPAVRYHDEQVARAVLAHFLNLGTQTGSWALGSTFADFFTLSLHTTGEQIADTATQHVVEDLVDVNWGPDEPAPKICFDEIGARPDATALSALLAAGAIVSDDTLEAALRQMYGLPPANPPQRPTATGGGFSPEQLAQVGTDQTAGAAAPADAGAGYGGLSVAAAAVQGTLFDFDLEGELVDGLESVAAAAHDVSKQLRQLRGHEGGGQFAKTLDGEVIDALQRWARGEGSDRPLTRPDIGTAFTAPQLRQVIARTPGMHQPAPRASAATMERQLLEHVRTSVPHKPSSRAKKSISKVDVPDKPSAKKALPRKSGYDGGSITDEATLRAGDHRAVKDRPKRIPGGAEHDNPKPFSKPAAKKSPVSDRPTSMSDLAAELEGLTPAQKRAKLRGWGFDKAEIDQLVPLAKKPAPDTADVKQRLADAVGGKYAARHVPLGFTEDGSGGLDQAETAALESYLGGDFYDINDALRTSKGRKTTATTKSIDAAMARSATDADIAVYRGIDYLPDVFGARANKSLVGAAWTEHGYTSTTTDRAIAEDFSASVILRILVPQGSPALRGEPSESEVMLGRGQRLHVVADTGPAKNGERRIIDVIALRAAA